MHGGLEAFRTLLAALPAETGMAFILIQHLDPKHASFMADLLVITSPKAARGLAWVSASRSCSTSPILSKRLSASGWRFRRCHLRLNLCHSKILLLRPRIASRARTAITLFSSLKTPANRRQSSSRHYAETWGKVLVRHDPPGARRHLAQSSP